jgi:hypothetical protein
MNNLFTALMDYIFGEAVSGLSEFFTTMNGMGADVLELPWIEAIVLFFQYVGWALFIAGLAVAVFDCVIEAQNGKSSVRDLALNAIKAFLAVSLFTKVPVELFKFCVELQGQLGQAICDVFQMGTFTSIGTLASNIISALLEPTAFNLLTLIMIGYAVIKCFFANIKRGGILVINIAVCSLYMLSVPRGFTDGFYGWCRQVAALCLTTILQTTLLTAGLLTCADHALLGIGIMLSANEVPRIAERFGLDTSVKMNFMSAYYAVNTAVGAAKKIAAAVIK